MTSTETDLCCVCSEATNANTIAYCSSCRQPYHLNQRNDIPGKDCGEVWISEENLALEFGCLTCITAPAGGGALDDILDLAEASAATGWPEFALVEAAAAGRLAHRRTSGGVYLFERVELNRLLSGRS